MGRKRYTASPDGGAVLDADRGSGAQHTKLATAMAGSEFHERAATREGARDLDKMVETLPGLNRQQRDRDRAMPRDVTGPVPDPRMERSLGAADQVREPLSARQRSSRSVTKHAAQGSLRHTEKVALARLVNDEDVWRRVNDELSDSAGDIQMLDDTQRARIQRCDRAIMAYERANDRSHVVYANVQMPAAVNSSNLAGFCRNTFTPGTTLDFDRFTAGAHTLHQIEPEDGAAGQRTAVFEIATQRGMYLGRSTGIDDTAHLLPRGLHTRVVGCQTVTYRRPDGSTGHREVIQITDN